MNLNLLDFVFIGVMGIFFLMSFFRGTWRELIALAGVLIGFVAAHWYYVALGDLLALLVQSARLAETIAFVVIFIAGYMLGSFASGVGDYYRVSGGSLGGRLIAGVIGLAKGLVVALALYWLIDALFPPLRDELRQSAVAMGLERIMDTLRAWRVL